MAHHEVFPPKDWEIRYEKAIKLAGIWDEVWNEQIKKDPIEVWVERWIKVSKDTPGETK